MKFDITLNDVIDNDYCKIAKKIWDNGGVRMVIDKMSQFLDLLLEAIIELMERYDKIKNEFDKKVSHRVESVDNFLRELYNEKYFEEMRDDIY